MPDQPQLIVFDLGGVVVRICRSIKEAGARCAIEVRDEDIAPDRRAQRRAVHARYERGLIGCEEFLQELSQTTDGRYSPAQFRAIHEAWIIDEYPGVSRLIDDLHAAGVATGVLSNTNRIHWEQMQPTVLADGSVRAPKFPTPSKPVHKHASHLLGLAKPDAAIYAEFARRTGFAPESIVFFDDFSENVEAARAAGWTSHLIDHLGDPAGQLREVLRSQHYLLW